jgi:hypothetical protein
LSAAALEPPFAAKLGTLVEKVTVGVSVSCLFDALWAEIRPFCNACLTMQGFCR